MSSLRTIHSSKGNNLDPRIFLRTNACITKKLHENILHSISPLEDNSFRFPLEAHALLDELFRAQGGESASRTIDKDCLVWNQILNLADSSRPREWAESPVPVYFPGPMACTLSRKNFHQVFCLQETDLEQFKEENIEYLLTEKSDGLRTLMYLSYNPSFFGWKIHDIEAQLSLLDTISLYAGMKKLLTSDAKHVCIALSTKLKAQICHRECQTETEAGLSAYLLKATATSNESSVKLCITQTVVDPHKIPDEFASASLQFLPETGREFVYMFDRSCDSLYLLNEPAQITKNVHSRFANTGTFSLLVDGELYQEIGQEKSLAYAIFDIFDASEKLLETISPPHSDSPLLDANPSSTRSCSQMCLRSRLKVIRSFFPDHSSRPSSYSFTAFYKEYYELDEVEKVLSMIKPRGDKYVFDERHFNDGLIFTPVSQRYFRLSPGRSRHLLKWKWAEKQSIDWLVHADGHARFSEDEVEAAATIQRAHLLFHIKHKIGGGGVVLEGHVQLPQLSHIRVPNSCSPLRSVCELQLEPSADGAGGPVWRLMSERSDKREGNSFLTVCNVLEAIAERITATDIEKLCLAKHVHTAPKATYCIPSRALPPVYLLAKIFPRGDMKDLGFQPVIKLQTLVDPKNFSEQKSETSCDPRVVERAPQHQERKAYVPQRPFPVNIMDESQYTFAAGADPAPMRAALAMAIANTGGSETYSEVAVQVYFDPSQGKWVIFHVQRRHAGIEITAQQLITHLLAIIAKQHETGERVAIAAPGVESPMGIFERSLRTAFTNDTQVYFPVEDSATNGEAVANRSVFHHYDRISTQMGREEAQADKCNTDICAHVRCVNNFLKFVLQAYAMRAALASRDAEPLHPSRRWVRGHRAFVLDLCSGRGGDLMKMKHFHGEQLADNSTVTMRGALCIDGSLLSLGAAACRYAVTPGLSTNATRKRAVDRRQQQTLPVGIPLRFVHADCFAHNLQGVFTNFFNSIGEGEHFDAVSIKFAIHYAFRDEAALRRLFANVSAGLRPGGVLVATYVDEEVFAQNLQGTQQWASSGGVCTIRKTESGTSPYGKAYSFALGNVVDGETEYIVNGAHLLAIAEEYGLTEVVLTQSFADLFRAAIDGADLLHDTDSPFEVTDATSAFDPASFPDRSTAFFRKIAGEKKRPGPEVPSERTRWHSLPAEVQEICGLYRGIILRKTRLLS